MSRNAMLATAAVFAVALTDAPAAELLSVSHSATQKTVQSDAVVIGKVTAIEAEEVEVLPHQGAADKAKMRVAVIKVETGLIGAKNVTHVKVLIPGAAAEQPAVEPGAGGPFVRRRGYQFDNGAVVLKESQEGLFFLVRHPTAVNYYAISPAFAPADPKADAYKDDVAKVKAVVATFADPLAALTADKAEDRVTAAATLIQKYRRRLTGPAKEVAIPAEESKAILKALLDADWTAAEKPQPGVVLDHQAQPVNLMSLLGLYPGANGFPAVAQKPGESYAAKYQEVFEAWHAKSGDKFEIKKVVPKE